LVHVLKALGEEHVDDPTLEALRARLTPQERARALRESRYVTIWVHEAIKRLALGEAGFDG